MVPEKSPKKRIAVLTGPTASGKTALSLEFVNLHAGQFEIINADSLLFYRGLDIGTAKPNQLELETTPHHLIDICNPDHTITAGDFSKLAEAAIKEIYIKNKKPIIIGGSGFYLKALLHGLWAAPKADPQIRAQLETFDSKTLFNRLQKIDPKRALTVGPNDRYRIIRSLEIFEQSGKTSSELETNEKPMREEFELLVIERKDLETRIEKRTEKMIESGLVTETQNLLNQWGNIRPLESVGYGQVKDYLFKKSPKGRKIDPSILGLKSEINLATRQLVKKQRTWFKSQKQAQLFELPQDKSALLSRLNEIYGL